LMAAIVAAADKIDKLLRARMKVSAAGGEEIDAY
jgi:hypothetical protein